VRLVIGAAVAVVVLVAGFLVVKALTGGGGGKTTVASAQTPANNGPGGRGFRGGGTFGTLQSVDGSTLTVATRNGDTATVLSNSSTRITKSVDGTVGDIKVGDRIVTRGTSSGTDTVTADRISDMGSGTAFGPGGQGRRNGGQGRQNGQNGQNGANGPNAANGTNANGAGAAGTVTGVNGSVITVQAFDGSTKTINTTPSTTVSVLKSATLQDLTTGQPVTVFGTTNSDGTITANAIQQGGRFGGPGGFGPDGGQGGQGGPAAGGNSGGQSTDNPVVN
jgi:hypothetical protein